MNQNLLEMDPLSSYEYPAYDSYNQGLSVPPIIPQYSYDVKVEHPPMMNQEFFNHFLHNVPDNNVNQEKVLTNLNETPNNAQNYNNDNDIKPDIRKTIKKEKQKGKRSSYWSEKINDDSFKFYGCAMCNVSYPTLAELDQHVTIHKDRLTSYDLKIKNMMKRKKMKKEQKKLKKLKGKVKKEEKTDFDIPEIKPEDGYIGNEKAVEYNGESSNQNNENEPFNTDNKNDVKQITSNNGKDDTLATDKNLEKIYKCFACQKQFTLSYYLKLHVRSHTDEKPYTCSICGQSFITASKLGRHNKRIHLAVRYQCRICYRFFSRFENLTVHFDKKHPEDKLEGEPYDFNAILPYLKELEEQLREKSENDAKPKTEDVWGDVWDSGQPANADSSLNVVPKALANAADAVESGGKSPVSALNELGVRVNYSVLQQGGPAHCPSFTVAVTVADMTFEGWGHSKREARASAARACLSALLARAGRVLPAPNAKDQDFTQDEPNAPVSDFQCLEVKMKPSPSISSIKSSDSSPEGTPPPSCPATALFGANHAATALKSPINVLYENYPGLNFICTFGDGSPLESTQAPLQLSHSMRFKVVCTIKDQKFEGYGSSKKLAKLAAARSALAALDEGRAESPPTTSMAGFLPQTLADHIGKLVNEKFNEVMRGDLVHSKRKVLAGIVITTGNRTEDARVIAVTTGTKCVSGEHMSVRGRVLNDCHAEVAARRCLQRHLYAQLLMYASADDPSVPIPSSDLEPLAGGGFGLKPERRLHLYVSTAPCGDGRIFSPHEQPEPEPDRHPNRLARGQLRTKIESGEGTIPVKNCNNVVQTWDGVMQGERLLTMSCSDKVARWCVVGLQGALLSKFMRPVYLHSLVLGSLLHPHHMYRAICGRIEAYITMLPPPFQLQRPLLARAASTEARTPARAPSFSVCWCCTNPLPEVVNATTGKLESGQPSLLCKQSMFARWQYLVKKLPLLPQEDNIGVEPVKMPDDIDHILYNEAKQLCPTYQVAKERLIEAFDKAKLGRWVKKPLEQDQFACELAHAPPHALFA